MASLAAGATPSASAPHPHPPSPRVRPRPCLIGAACLPFAPPPSRYVVAEAMAMGLPVVASKVGALPELVKHGETGFLVDPFSRHCRTCFAGALGAARA